MNNYLKLVFITDEDSQLTIMVPSPNLNLTDAQIKTAMQNIIATGAVESIHGVPITPYSAELVKVDETKLV